MKKLKEGAGRIESRVLGDLDRQMQTILHSQQPEHEKINLYNSTLEKAARYEKRLQDGKPQATEDRILADFEQHMQNILHSQKPPGEKMLLYRVSVKLLYSVICNSFCYYIVDTN